LLETRFLAFGGKRVSFYHLCYESTIFGVWN
jgi:hypothetical protein